MDNLVHIPVMLESCIEGLKLKDNGIYFDGTLGGGGHSYEILKRSSPNGKLVATDLDDYAIERATERLKEFNGRFTFVKDNFKNFSKIKEELNIEKFDGIILDLGVSSFQLDDRKRGFSYLDGNARLDMRMNKDAKLDAEKIVNEYSESELKKIFNEYGEERFSGIIARNIVNNRKINRITTVGQLNEIILKSIPKKFQHDGHPSKRTFQALRIEVNGELNGLYETVLDMGRSLNKGGRIVILTFHSLEDRIVKKAFKELETDCICDKSLPICVCGKKKEIEIITKHPIIASEEETAINSRSKSAKLRIAEKI
ncbi:MAG: 16S rRNA (cytosine(1402)-N(4))-methyltransferase RsmH [Clostridia bacterium]|nr:16S rRNA (cytosine(1402)-N(4))-methyltransferase RsmH [Clostridia bacterium]MBQ9514091.1 16S rRNA (cytosine(1402)-N(4))-methyltransferase RsmH [Clostridia bacterium]